MIYFVDEDVSQVRPFVTELLLRGYAVDNIFDADDAFRRLRGIGADDCQAVIIDVMLAVDLAAEQSRYTRENTAEFTRTGIRLLEDLVVANNRIFPARAMLFSMASSPEIVNEVHRVSKELKVPFLHKAQFGTPHAFGERIASFLQSVEQFL